jgi:NHLM bacteriocin system ABC transporter ATP-binding protein
MLTCCRLSEQEGPVQEVTGNTPLLLEGSEHVWLVLSERIDVFAVPVENGQPCGARSHVLRVAAGQLLFGVESEGPGASLRLLAVGIPGTRVLRLSRARLTELSQDAGAAKQLSGLLNGWVEGLTERVSGKRKPRPCIPLQLSVLSTERDLADPSLWSDLDAFHRLFLTRLAQGLRQEGVTAEERLRQRLQADSQFRQVTLARLTAVASTPPLSHPEKSGEDERLLAAFRLVADRLEIAVRPPAGPRDGRPHAPVLDDIARASHFRTRRVRLVDTWWQQDNGPLLAFLAADNRPVALLPTSAQSYELVDPETRTRTAVTPSVAAGLAPLAHTFYRPLPSHALTAWGLIRFGLQGCGAELRRGFVLALLGGLLGMAAPIGAGILFDTVVPRGSRAQLLLVTLALLVCAVAALLFQLSRDLVLLRLKGKMGSAIESGIWDHLLALPPPFFRRYTAGDLAVRANGIGIIRNMLSEAVVSTLFAGVFSLLSLGLLFWYDARLALVAIGLVLFVVAITAVSLSLQLPLQRGETSLRGKIAGQILQLLSGLSRLRVAAAEERALALWARDFSDQKRFSYRARCLANHFSAFLAVAPLLSMLAVFAAAAAWRGEGMSVGSFLAFLAALGQVLFALVSLGSTLNSALRIIPIWERVRPILGALPEVDAGKPEAGELSGEIEIGHVSFRYQPDGPLILDDVTLHIKPGQLVAVVGPSGAGKSTLLRLLLGFEKPQAGSLYYDGQDLAGMDLHSVRRQIGVVLQHGRLIPGDISTNILGSSPLTLEDAREAARLSGLDEDLEQMPMGLHTVISEGGGTLSGGQRQRLLIARAIVSRPRILLFDDATSALDNNTQALVSRSLEGLKATRLVVAHRLSTIRNADVIYVLDGGRIVQQGSYEELMRQGGLFADLARRQLT